MKAINYACFKLEQKATKNVKNKINFIHILGNNSPSILNEER